MKKIFSLAIIFGLLVTFSAGADIKHQAYEEGPGPLKVSIEK